MSRRPRRATLAAIVAVGVLALTACSPDSWYWLGIDGGGDASGPTSASPRPDASDESVASAADCPIGTWVLDNDSWDAALTAIWVASAPEVEVLVTGALELEWADDGTYLLTARDAVSETTGVADGSSFVQRVSHDGTEAGTWTGSGPDYALDATDSTGMDSVVTFNAGGGAYVVDQSQVAAEPWSGTMTVTCTPTGMTTTVVEASGSLTVAWLRR